MAGQTPPTGVGLDLRQAVAGLDPAAPAAGLDLTPAASFAPPPPEPPGPFARGLKTGVADLKSIGGGVLQYAGRGLGAKPLETLGETIGQNAAAESAPYRMQVEDVSKAFDQGVGPGLGAAADLVKYTVGNQIPMLATTIAGGVGGRLAAGALGATRAAAGVSAAEKAAAVAKVAAGTATPGEAAIASAVKAADLGAELGLGASSVGMELGQIAPEGLKPENNASMLQMAAGALVSGATDTVLPIYLARKMGLIGAAERALTPRAAGLGAIAKDVGGTALKAGAFEAGQETTQSAIERAASNQPLTGPEAGSDYLNSGVMGGIMGILTGGIAGGVHSMQRTVKGTEQVVASPTEPAVTPTEPAPVPPTPEAVHADLVAQHAAATENLAALGQAVTQAQQQHDALVAARKELDNESKLEPGQRRTKSEITVAKKEATAQIKAAKAKIEELGGQMFAARNTVEALAPQIEASRQTLQGDNNGLQIEGQAPAQEVTPLTFPTVDYPTAPTPYQRAGAVPDLVQPEIAPRAAPVVSDTIADPNLPPPTPAEQIDRAVKGVHALFREQGMPLTTTEESLATPPLTPREVALAKVEQRTPRESVPQTSPEQMKAVEENAMSVIEPLAATMAATKTKTPEGHAKVAAKLTKAMRGVVQEAAKQGSIEAAQQYISDKLPTALKGLGVTIDATDMAKAVNAGVGLARTQFSKGAVGTIRDRLEAARIRRVSDLVSDYVASGVRGSVYHIRSDGTSTRVTEGGVQFQRYPVRFVTENVANRLLDLRDNFPDSKFTVAFSGASGTISQDGVAAFEFQARPKPEIGLHPVEDGGDNGPHVGSKLKSVRREAAANDGTKSGDLKWEAAKFFHTNKEYLTADEWKKVQAGMQSESRAALTQDEFDTLSPEVQAAAADAYTSTMRAKGTALIGRLLSLIGDRPELKATTFSAEPGGHIGSYTRTGPLKAAISMALNAKEGLSVADHEGYHFAEDWLLTSGEKKVVANALREGKPLFDQLVAKLRQYDRENGTRLTDEVTAIPAEARAYAFEFWRRGEFKAEGALAKAWAKIKQFFERVANAVRGQGFQSIEDVFVALSHGQMAEREMVAPEGRATRNSMGADYLQSPAFKKWFGDSKVVDKDGKPLVVYHGTAPTGWQFEGEGVKFEGGDFTAFNGPAYFAANKAYADGFAQAQANERALGNNPRTMEVFLSIKNPLDKRGSPDYWRMLRNNTAAEIAKAKTAGYDGIVLREVDEALRPELAGDVFVAFSPTQIKSAIGNTGAFDPNNPDIRYSGARGNSWYYSALTDAVVAINTKAAPAQGWKDQIKGLVAKGVVKQVEIDAVGLNDWLDLRPGKVTKDQVVSFLKENGVQVREVVLGEPRKTAPSPGLPSQFVVKETDTAYHVTDPVSGLDVSIGKGGKVDSEASAREYATERFWQKTESLDDQARSQTREPKFSGYQLPGGPLARDTEILTHEGWMRIDAVAIGDEVLTRRDEDAGLEWAPVEAKPEVFAEKLYHFASQSIDMRVTPCHKMVVKRRRRSSAELLRVTAKELWGMAECVAPLTGKWAGEKLDLLYGLPANDVAELTGWYIAEGSAITSPTGHKSTLAIAQSREANAEKCTRLEALFLRLAIKWNYVGGSYYLSIKSMPSDFVEMLHAQPISGGKYVPGFMFDLSADIQQSLLDGLLLGDGCLAKQAGRKSRWTYFTNSKQLADDVQVLALLTGKRGTVKQRPGGLYTVGINSGQWASIDDAKHAIVDYNDTAYCVTVKNHSIYVRTNGVAAFTGNSNYRELLLTLPAPGVAEYERIKTKYVGGHVLTQSEVDVLRNPPDVNSEFRSTHFDQPNILAHVRFNERTDAEGKRVLFLEELQSDWAQKGRKEGFKGEERTAFQVVVDGNPAGAYESMAEAEAAKQRALKYNAPEKVEIRQVQGKVQDIKGVPSAPFVTKTEAWTALALKRMIRYAAENGFDKVAWTTGEQQAERYDLSKQINRVEISRPQNGTFAVYAYKEKTDTVPALQTRAENESELADIIGKDLAAKVAKQPIGTKRDYTGIDLKVGGEGMKGYYDKIVPSVANEVLKRLGGGKVEQIAIPVKNDARVSGTSEGLQQVPRETARRLHAAGVEVLSGVQAQFGTNYTPMRAGTTDYLFDSVFNGPSDHFWIRNGAADDALLAELGVEVKGVRPPTQPGFTITPALAEHAANGLPLFSKAAVEMRNRMANGELEAMQIGEQYAHIIENAKPSSDILTRVLGIAREDILGGIGRWWTNNMSTPNYISSASSGFKNVYQAFNTYSRYRKILSEQLVRERMLDWYKASDADRRAAFDVMLKRTLEKYTASSQELTDLLTTLTPAQRKLYDQATGMIAGVLQRQFDSQKESRKRHLGAEAYEKWLADRQEQVTALIEQGYVPLRRYGDYSVEVYMESPDGKRVKAGLEFFNSPSQAKTAALAYAKEIERAGVALKVEMGRRSKNERDTGVSLEQFLGTLRRQGIDISQAERERLVVAMTNADSLVRTQMMRREGLAGFSTDSMRVLHEFGVNTSSEIAYARFAPVLDAALDGAEVTSDIDARTSEPVITIGESFGKREDGTANNLWERDGPMSGFYKDRANAMADTTLVPDRQSVAATKLRTAGVMYFIGGSISGAAVNTLSVPMVLTPYLSTHTDYLNATMTSMKTWKDAWQHYSVLRDMDKMKNPDPATAARLDAAGIDKGMRDAIVAAADHIFDTEIHMMLGISQGSLYSKSRNIQRAAEVWMAPFRVTEQTNRLASFMAAYRVATTGEGVKQADGSFKKLSGQELFRFASETVDQTQNNYNTNNLPGIMSNPIGALMFQFKSFPLFIIEATALMYKANPKSAVYMLLGLTAMAGVQGLPFAEEILNLIDVISQQLFNSPFNSRRAMRNAIKSASDAIGAADLSDALMRGLVNELTGVGVATRVSSGFLPGTRLGTADTSSERVLSDIAGAPWSMIKDTMSNVAPFVSGVAHGDWRQAADAIRAGSPIAVRNIVKGAEQLSTGYASDSRGRKTVDVSTIDGLLQLTGLSSAAVTKASDMESIIIQTKAFYTQVSKDLETRLVKAYRDGDTEQINRIISLKTKWNEQNPTMPILANPAATRRDIMLAGVPLNRREQILLGRRLGGEFSDVTTHMAQ